MTKSRNVKRGAHQVPEPFTLNDKTARSHVEAALGCIDDGSPRMLVRFHLHEIKRILDAAGHENVVVGDEMKRCAIVPDSEIRGE